MVKELVKGTLSRIGLNVSRRDRLMEQIPRDYLVSPYLPHVYRQNLGRLFCLQSMFERATAVAGDIVECGVSIGHGILCWSLLAELTGQRRRVWGFDSFSGFPPSAEADRKADQSFETGPGDYASSPEVVMKVLADGRVSPDFIRDNVRLIGGLFDSSLSRYDGQIALLHLDCDLYESYLSSLNALYSRVAPGGVILFDEYEDTNFPGAKRAVDEFFASRPEKPTRYHAYEYVKYFVVKQ